MSPAPLKLGRAAALGLGSGFFLGAGLLGFRAFEAFRFQCPRLPDAECGLEEAAARDIGRAQGLVALALGLLAAALFMLLRARPPSSSRSPG